MGGVWVTNSALTQPVGIAAGPVQMLYIAENTGGVNLGLANPFTSQFMALAPAAGRPFGIAAVRAAPQFISEEILPGDVFKTSLNAEAGRFVGLFSSTDLITWQFQAGVPAVTNAVSFTDSTTEGASRYYRALGY